MIHVDRWQSLLPGRIQRAKDEQNRFKLNQIKGEIEYMIKTYPERKATLDNLMPKDHDAGLVKEFKRREPIPEFRPVQPTELQKLKFALFQLPDEREGPTQSHSLGVKKRMLFKKTALNSSDSRTKDSEDHDGDAKEQERLAAAMAEHSSRLLENSKIFKDQLDRDRQELTQVEDQIGENAERIAKERQSIKQISASSWKLTFMIWASILMAILIFLFAFFYMRIFSTIPIKTKTVKTITTTAASITETVTTVAKSTSSSIIATPTRSAERETVLNDWFYEEF
jgi:hypothetical protein